MGGIILLVMLFTTATLISGQSDLSPGVTLQLDLQKNANIHEVDEIDFRAYDEELKIRKHFVIPNEIANVYNINNIVTPWFKRVANEPLVKTRLVIFAGIINVGTPPQPILTLFDTGSSQLWIPSVCICPRRPSYCDARNTFNHSKSSTYVKDGRSFGHEYESGSLGGIVGRDDVSVSSLKVKSQVFGEATIVDYTFDHEHYDGIVGLIYYDLSKNQPFNFFVSMILQKVVVNPVFSFFYSKTDPPFGEITFGGDNPQRHTGNFFYAPLLSDYDWVIFVNEIQVQGIKIGGPFNVSIDTGCTLISGPPAITNAINKAIGATYSERVEQSVVDCSKLNDLPTVTIVINNQPFPLLPQQYVIMVKIAKDTVFCLSGFYPLDDDDLFLIGNTFIKMYYTKFDVGRKRVGFAPAT